MLEWTPFLPFFLIYRIFSVVLIRIQVCFISFCFILQITLLILRITRTYLLEPLFHCDIKYIKVPNCSVMIRYREIDKDWMAKNKAPPALTVSIKWEAMEQWDCKVRVRVEWERQTRTSNLYYVFIYFCWNRQIELQFRYFNLIKLCIYTVIRCGCGSYLFYECHILLSFSANKIDFCFLFFVFSIRVCCATHTHTAQFDGSRIARMKKDERKRYVYTN